MFYYLSVELLPQHPYNENFLQHIPEISKDSSQSNRCLLGGKTVTLNNSGEAVILPAGKVKAQFSFFDISASSLKDVDLDEASLLKEDGHYYLSFYARKLSESGEENIVSSPFFADGVFPLDHIYLSVGHKQFELGSWQKAKDAWQNTLELNPFQVLAQGLILDKIYFNSDLHDSAKQKDAFFNKFFENGPGASLLQLRQSANEAQHLADSKGFLSKEEAFLLSLGGEETLEDLDCNPDDYCSLKNNNPPRDGKS